MVTVRRELRVAADALAGQEPVLGAFVEAYGPPRLARPGRVDGRFAALARMVCYQQLAGRAASVIHRRFEARFGGRPTPAAVRACAVEELRACGLSGSKAASIHDLAAKVLDGTVELDRLGRLSDERVVEELTTVRGIGVWTAQMFLMFQLGRLDVWPTGDLGVRNGYARIHSLATSPSARELEPLGDPYRPYRSIAAWYCWRAVDVIVPG